MAKCIRCGKSTALRGNAKIADADLCVVCFKELGFSKNDLLTASLYKYNDIKDGRDQYYANKAKRQAAASDAESVKLTFAHYGDQRDVDATDGEVEIFETIRSLLEDMGYDTGSLKLVRKSDSYVSACMKSSSDYGMMDLARIKFTDRAKWIKVCPEFDRVDLKHAGDVEDLAEEIRAGYVFNEPYL